MEALQWFFDFADLFFVLSPIWHNVAIWNNAWTR